MSLTLTAPALRRALLGLGRFAVLTVLPALLLITLALASGLVRTTALCAFVLVAVLRGAMLALDHLGDRAPSPRLSWEVSR